MSCEMRSNIAMRRPRSEVRPGFLQRQCACGSHSSSGEECEDCKRKKLQPKASGTGPVAVPAVVHDALRSAGSPLDHSSRSFFEPRFRHDFSGVRIHTDGLAAHSARAVNALAYTVGNSIVFDSGQFSPHASSGRRLLAHELAHVVQNGGGAAPAPKWVAGPQEPSEREADQIADEVMQGKQRHGEPVPLKERGGHELKRKLRVENPAARIPNPDGRGVNQTNGQLVQEALRTMADGSDATVNTSTGVVTLATAYCPGFLGGLVQGARSGYRSGYMVGSVGGRVPLFGPIIGAITGFFGAIGGAFAGLFGNESISAAGASSTPTGSKCLCTIVNSSNWWTIEVNDADQPRTMHENDPSDPRGIRSLPGGRVRITSPNSPRIWGAATMSGSLENAPTWLQLSHELCGHAWLQEKHLPESSDTSPGAVRNPETGQLSVANRESLQGNSVGPHGDEFAIQRENLIRQEHHLSPRGYRIRDPYCGESFWRDRATPQGAEHFTVGGDPSFPFMQQCAFLRSQLPENRDGRYGIDQQIPEHPQSSGR
jgi:Domain of unknown function (DUF4157)